MLYRGSYGFLLANGQPVLHMDTWDITSDVPMNEVTSFDVQALEQIPGVGSWSASASGTADYGNTSNQHLLLNAHMTKTPIMFAFGLYNAEVTGDDKYNSTNLKKMTYYQGLCYISSFNANFGASDNATVSIELTGTGAISLLPSEVEKNTYVYPPVILSPGSNAITTVTASLLGTGDRGNEIVYGVFDNTSGTIIGNGEYLKDGTNNVKVQENSSYTGVISSTIQGTLVKNTKYTLKFAQVKSNLSLTPADITAVLTATAVSENKSLPKEVKNVTFSDATGTAP